MAARFASGRYARAVCDRCGLQGRYTEMVREPGTGFLVHPRHMMRDSRVSVRPVQPDAVQLMNPRPDMPFNPIDITFDMNTVTFDQTNVTWDQS